MSTHSGEGDRIRADPASEVGDAEGLALGHIADEATGVMSGDRQSCGLGQSVAGEEHILGERSELRCRLLPQAGLREQGCSHICGEALFPQGR